MGGDGNDTLYGEAGADVFLFSVSGGARVVTDFQPGLDEVRIDGQQSAFIRETDAGLLIDWQSGSVLLEHIGFSDLQQGDMVFV